jgi:hypothetical protein
MERIRRAFSEPKAAITHEVGSKISGEETEHSVMASVGAK